MQMNTWSVLALAIAVATTQLAYAEEVADDDSKDIGAEQPALSMEGASQAQAKGFLEDGHLRLLSRNMAYYKNFRNTDPASQNYRNDWSQAEMLTYTSGYTQGTVGVGLDAFANGAVRLSGGGGTGGGSNLPVDGSHCDENAFGETISCQGQASYGMVGGALKMRISETELKAGDLNPQSPVFGTWDGYLMPAHTNGVMFSSSEIEGLALQGGHFTSGNAENSTNRNGNLGTTYGLTRVDRADFIGGDYAFSETVSAGLHAANFEDVWNQYYADLYHYLPLGKANSLLTSINYYKTVDAGDARAGEIDNNAFSVALALTMGPHKFTFAHQRINGDTPFDYLGISGFSGADNGVNGANPLGTYNGGGSIWLANSSQWCDFNAPGEKSYKLQYDLDASGLGIPGLGFMVRYVTGRDSDGSGADPAGAYSWESAVVDGEEWERDIQVAYVVQSGPARALAFKLRQATYRGNSAANINAGSDNEEIRFITEYPLDIL
ncbi:OprD family porin [Pseudomonas sp. BN515]|nr:OprD family porin [Pseudomonas sp. BN515]